MTEPDRLISPQPEAEDNALDRAIRPRRLADYVGQAAVREQMDLKLALVIMGVLLRNTRVDLAHRRLISLNIPVKFLLTYRDFLHSGGKFRRVGASQGPCLTFHLLNDLRFRAQLFLCDG